MSVNGCLLVAVEGTHASGKTTVVHALTAHYRERGILVGCTSEPARTRPLVEAIAPHGTATFDLTGEVDLFAAQLSATLRATRHHQLLICDKTIVNVLAHARLGLMATPDSHHAAVLDAMAAFCRAWAPASYDAVFYLPDRFNHPADPIRAKSFRRYAEAVRATCADVGLALTEVPAGLDTAGRVAWIALRVDPLLTALARGSRLGR